MVKAYSYIRFSRPEQMRGDSLRRQTQAANEWAAKRGVVIDESLRDLGISAFRGANRIKGALGRFHDLVEKGRVPAGSYLIVESLDRLSRKAVREVLPDFMLLINAGIVIVTLLDRQEYSAQRIDDEPMALFASLMVMQRAHEESKTKAQRLSKAWGEKRDQAQATTRVMSARVPAWLRVVGSGEDRRIEFIPATPDRPDGRDLVRGIFLDAIRGHGRRTIAARLNKATVPPLEDGKAWHASYILKILQNRATYGEHQAYRRDEAGRRIAAGPPVPGYYPAAVTEAAFLRANAARESRAKGAAGRRGPTGAVNLVKGMAFCACGGNMARLYKGPAPKGAAYLVCAESRRGACGIDRRWRLDFVEERILARTSRVDIGKVLAAAGEEEPRGPTLADLEARVVDLSGKLARLLPLVELGIDGTAERAVALQAEVDQAKAEASAMRNAAARIATEPSAEQRRLTIVALTARLAAASDEERAELRTRLAQEFRGAFDKVVFGRNAFSVVYRGAMQFGGVLRPSEKPITLTVFSDDPGYLDELAIMYLEPEVARPQGDVAEFVRRSRANRGLPVEEIEESDLLAMPSPA